MFKLSSNFQDGFEASDETLVDTNLELIQNDLRHESELDSKYFTIANENGVETRKTWKTVLKRAEVRSKILHFYPIGIKKFGWRIVQFRHKASVESSTSPSKHYLQRTACLKK